MTKVLSNEQRFGLVHPLFDRRCYDKFQIPIMKKVTENMLNFSNVRPLNGQNLSIKNNNTRKFILNFSYDNKMERFWNKPLEHIPLLQSAYAVATPDYSIDPQMGFPEYLCQIYKNRWLGCCWQEHGILTVPSVGWTTEDFDDLSFAGLEKGTIVVISTLGSKRDVTFFMRGYNEMIRRIDPSLIVVYGDMLPEMLGRFVNFRYKESFQPKNSTCVQGTLFEISPIFERR